MKCDDAEKLIVMFDVLDEGQRTLVEKHMATCAACSRYRDQVAFQRSVSRQVFNPPPTTDITSRVMASLPHRAATDSLLKRFLAAAVVEKARYAMVAVSAVLVVGFMIEFNQVSQNRVAMTSSPIVAGGNTLMDARAFAPGHQNGIRADQSPKTISLYQCLQACARQREDCEPCREKFTKIYKYNERI